jgi:nicotinate phosphoribosyltransferase
MDTKHMIYSILDTDTYKASMQYFVLQQYPDVDVSYTFNNRNKSMKFTPDAVAAIQMHVKAMANLRLKDHEYDWMKEHLPFLPITYRQYLSAYRFNPDQVKIWLDKDSQLQITIAGKWRDTILWEVPLMAIISGVYFQVCDTDWNSDGQDELAYEKAKALDAAGCKFADFGTRRRRNFNTQDRSVEIMKQFKGFVGTSNPNIAQRHGVKALGTVAHECFMGISVLEGLRHSNRFTMDKWQEVYKADLGIALCDTYGLDAFLGDFSLLHAKSWDGVRHDSGDPKVFTDKIIAHYQKLRIDPTTKTIVFSDGLDVPTAIDINEYCKGKIRCSFGIGTSFSNDFRKVSNGEKSKPLNMVIKLRDVNGIPVVKLSDSPGKAIGDADAVRVAKWTFFGEKL